MERSSAEAPSNPDHAVVALTAGGDDTVAGNQGNATSSISPLSRGRRRNVEWPTIDGPLGLSQEESIGQARKFFKFGFLLLPWLWAVNCFYFWPVLRKPTSHSHPQLRYYVVGSAIGFVVFTVLLTSWALTFAIGGEHLFGHAWDQLVMYNLADRYGLTGWI
ncbi:probable gamma-secretase subunit PEN-2 isoform X3 [Coffea arabica]|uniref:Probable gamma-secretase subunit PEN-2 isoform X3 n=1 Tax=Coffea arabica TaxID=13443 RepID=A0A6P6T5Y6_COFAR|nr:probable gamma-secretase subunit PEN-2 [Coffea arabica]